jgi:tetratricopeptide (TPR) repeat protein
MPEPNLPARPSPTDGVRPAAPAPKSVEPKTVERKLVAPKTAIPTPAQVNPAQVIEEATLAMRRGDAATTLRLTEPLLRDGKTDFAAHCLAAQAQANGGHYDVAQQHCQAAAALQPFEALPLHIMARIAEERGDREAAKNLLKKVLYLAPSLVVPYLELSAIYEHEGDMMRARKMRETALELLEPLGEHETVPAHPLSSDASLTGGQLKGYLREANS